MVSIPKSLSGDSLADLPTVKSLLMRVLQPSAQGGPVCEEYDMGGDMRWACAVVYTNALGVRSVLIGGFDHDEQDMNIVRPSCPDVSPAVTARQVSESQSEEDLENFVKGAIMEFVEVAKTGLGISQIHCLGRKGPWKHGSIYLFVMTAGADGKPPIVFLNGNNQEFTGGPFVNILDEDGVDVGKIIIEAAGEHGKGGIVRYKWDDPAVEGDEVNEPGMSPGTSPKVSYVEGLRTSSGDILIFGSGIYPAAEDDDDGCAIAGADSKPWSAVFNLFLIVFSLCIVFLWKDRSKA